MDVAEPLIETPAIPASNPKLHRFNSSNAADYARKAVQTRLKREASEREAIIKARADTELVRPLLEQAIAKATAPAIEPRDSFVSNRLRIVREQLSQLDEQLSQAEDWKATKAICDSIKALSDVERILDGRALPGSRRPGRETPAKRTGEVGPVE